MSKLDLPTSCQQLPPLPRSPGLHHRKLFGGFDIKCIESDTILKVLYQIKKNCTRIDLADKIYSNYASSKREIARNDILPHSTIRTSNTFKFILFLDCIRRRRAPKSQISPKHTVRKYFAALINSSAKHSATVLTFLNAASLAPIVSKAIAWLTLLKGDTSTA